MFIRDENGTAYNLNTVKKIVCPYSQPGEAPKAFDRLNGELVGGGVFTVHRKDFDAIIDQPQTVIAAPAGTFVLDYFEGELQQVPVAGWLVLNSGATKALRLSGLPFEEPEAFLLSDGSVWDPIHGSWPNADTYRIFRTESE